MEISAGTHALAAIMILQSLILALIDRGLLSGDDVLSALDDVMEAQSGEAGADPAFKDIVLRVLTRTTKQVTH